MENIDFCLKAVYNKDASRCKHLLAKGKRLLTIARVLLGWVGKQHTLVRRSLLPFKFWRVARFRKAAIVGVSA